MAKSKHDIAASGKIDDYINSLPNWSKKICNRLREIVLKSHSKIIEDWKWGPNYYLNGMVCGYAGFKTKVNFVFFQGALLKDKKKILIANPATLHNRHLEFTDLKEINETVLLGYLIEAIENNLKGKKLTETKIKIVEISADVKKEFKKACVLNYFEHLAFSHRKEYMLWINDAKKADTRVKRINQAISKLGQKQMMHDKYKKH